MHSKGFHSTSHSLPRLRTTITATLDRAGLYPRLNGAKRSGEAHRGAMDKERQGKADPIHREGGGGECVAGRDRQHARDEGGERGAAILIILFAANSGISG